MKRDGNGWRPSSRKESPLRQDLSEAATIISEPVPRSQRPSSYAGMLVDGRYLIEHCIGQGGMSVVYRCRHVSIGKSLAMKIIRLDQHSTPEAPQRFLLEAKAASAIGNEHIIDITDCGTLPDGAAYLVMELLQGIPLSELIELGEPLPLPRILSIVLQVVEGLSAAHAAGIVHRDLKPENIFLVPRKAEDFVKILDFGVAKMLRADGRRMTRTGYIVGTPHYMAPEQASGAAIDQRGDIYALGVILYELVTGRLPFEGAHYVDVLTKHLTEPPPRLVTTGRVPAIPAGFEQIVHKCLAKRPDERFQSVSELAVELERLYTPGAEPRPPHAAAPPLNSSVPCAPSQQVLAPPPPEYRGLIACAAALSLLALASLWHLRQPAPAQGGSPPAAAAASMAAAQMPSEGAGRAAAPATAMPAPGEPPVPVPPVAVPPMAPAQPVTVVELGPGKTVEIEARTRLSLRLDQAGPPTESAPGVPKPKPVGAAHRARPKPRATRAPVEPPQPELVPKAADELIRPWPARP